MSNRREFMADLVAYSSLGLMFPKIFADTITSPRRLVWISLNGGWDILESADPKPQSSSGLDMIYNYSDANLIKGSSDVRIGRWFPNLASHGESLTVARGLTMGTTSHDAGRVYIDTAILSSNGKVNAASIPAIIASESSATIPIIQLAGGTSPQIDRGLLKPLSVVRAQDLDLYRSLYPSDDAAQQARLQSLNYLKTRLTDVQTTWTSTDRSLALSAAVDKVSNQINQKISSQLILTADDKAPFNFKSSASDTFALALKLLKNDLCSCINLGLGGFDTHSQQTKQLQPILQGFDQLLSALIQELKNLGQLDRTLIIVNSDFGRTPKMNMNQGRDHWPVGGAFLIGGGLKGSRAVGGTDDNLRALYIDSNGNPTSNVTTLQLSPISLASAAVEWSLGKSYLKYRPYLQMPNGYNPLTA
jgi:hypothetical protein